MESTIPNSEVGGRAAAAAGGNAFNQAMSAIENDNINQLRQLLEPAQQHFELLRTGELLFAALELERQSIALELIESQINLSSINEDGSNCLMVAAKRNQKECLNRILDSKQLAVDDTDYFGWTALMYACYYGHSDITKSLLLAGAQADLCDLDHMSGLIWASGRGHTECVQRLIQLGKAKVNQVDKCGTSALIWACRKGHTEVAGALLKSGANIDSIGVFGWSALLVAVNGDHLDTMRLLLQHRPNVNTCDGQRHTPLIAASKEGKLEMVKLLLKARAFVNLSDDYGHTALIHAAKGAHLEVVDLLLKHHANVDHAGQDKKTALFWAVEKGNSHIVERLMQAKANLEVASKEGETCLLKAVKLRRVALVRALLAHQAKASATDRNGDTCLHLAVRMQSATIAQIILANPKNHNLLHKTNGAKKTPLMLDYESSSPIFPALLAMCSAAGSKSSLSLGKPADAAAAAAAASARNGSAINLDNFQASSDSMAANLEESQSRFLLVKKLASVLDQRQQLPNYRAQVIV